MYYEAVSLISSQQFTTLCAVMSTCQIAQVHGQMGFGNFFGNMFGLGYQPLRDYHYESRGYIQNTYPRNSYRIMDYEVAKARGLLVHQQKGKKNKKASLGGNKRGGGNKKGSGDDEGDKGDNESPAGGDDDEEDSGGGDPGTSDDLPIEEPGAKRKKRSFSIPPDVADADRHSGNVGGFDTITASVAMMLMTNNRVRVAAPDEASDDVVRFEGPRDDDRSRTDRRTTISAPPGESISVHYRDTNVSNRRTLKNIIKNVLSRPTDFNSSPTQFYNENLAKKDLNHRTEKSSKNNNNVHDDIYDSNENTVDEYREDNDDKDVDDNIFDADGDNNSYDYNDDKNDDEDDKDSIKDDGYIDSRKFIRYNSDDNNLKNDDKSMITDIDEIRLTTFFKVTQKIQSILLENMSGKKLFHYVNSLYIILKELVFDAQKFFEALVYTTIKFGRSVADANIRKLISTMINTLVLSIANALDQYIV